MVDKSIRSEVLDMLEDFLGGRTANVLKKSKEPVATVIDVKTLKPVDDEEMSHEEPDGDEMESEDSPLEGLNKKSYAKDIEDLVNDEDSGMTMTPAKKGSSSLRDFLKNK